MKLVIIALLILLLGCQDQYLMPDEKTETVILSYKGLEWQTGLQPMTRNSSEQNISRLNNGYKVIVTKKVAFKWVIDTILDCRLDNLKSIWNDVYLTSFKQFDQLSLTLRPGEYKISVFLNTSRVIWNNELKPGYIVSTDADISFQSKLPPAYTYRYENNPYFINCGNPVLSRELYAGYTSLVIGKKNNLTSSVKSIPVTITLKRVIGLIRFILDKNKENPFDNTQYYLRCTMESDSEFCEGINILGGGYRTGRKVLDFYSSFTSSYISPLNNKEYMIAEPQHATYYCPYVITDTALNCTIKNISITGYTGGPKYKYIGELYRVVEPNRISAILLTPTLETYQPSLPSPIGFILKEVTDINPVQVFSPLMEWNCD